MALHPLTQLRIIPSSSFRLGAPGPNDRAEVSVYRAFFLMGILCVLTAGCLLGAVALFGISRQGSFTASAWTPHVLAHANSQLYGWVGFFIMGFSLQSHGPTIARARLFHRMAWASLALMALGIGLRFAAEPLAAVDPGVWVPVGIFSACLQAVSVLIFVANTSITRYRPGGSMPWQTALVFTSIAWMLLVALAEPFFFAQSHQADRLASIRFVAEWFAPYRDAQFLGFVSMMIFGVALSKLGTCFGCRPATRGLGLAGLAIWNVGLLVRMLGWVFAFRSGLEPGSELGYTLGGALIGVAAFFLVGSSGIFERLEKPLRCHKFVKAAFLWLVAAGIMMALEPLHLVQIGQPFSHAYTGAIRHAVTVGFISQMIIGFSITIVSRMAGLADGRLAPLWATFWLLNLGNMARVILEVATDYTPAAFAPMGITGFVELTGLVLWAAHLVPMILGSRRALVGAAGLAKV